MAAHDDIPENLMLQAKLRLKEAWRDFVRGDQGYGKSIAIVADVPGVVVEILVRKHPPESK